jgi:drug/metabolite transporter superfamily protein YnfA
MNAKFFTPFRSRTFQLCMVFFVIAVVVWAARFSRSAEFGIYEDDWTIIPRAIEMSFSQLLEFIFNYISNFLGQGRPFHHSLIYFLSFVGWRIGELGGIYFIGYLIVASNAFLFYLLLKRLYSHQFALVGALAYSLYSADTTQAFLTHSLGLHPSLTFFLLATHLYLSHKYVFSYLLILMSLLTYETPFLLFLAVPLLGSEWNKRLIKRLLVHGAILAIFFISVYLLRLSVGELRVINLDYVKALETSIRHMLEGPVYGLGSYFNRARQMYWVLDNKIISSISISFPILFLLLYLGAIDHSKGTRKQAVTKIEPSLTNVIEKIKKQIKLTQSSDSCKNLFKLLVVSIVMLVLAYPLTLTSEPDLSFGRVTRNHFAAIVGTSLLIAGVWTIFTDTVRNRWIRLSGSAIFALGFAIMVGFGQVVQRDYTVGWIYQQEFWSDLLQLIPDANEGTAIIVDPSGMKEPIHILANTWNMPRVLERIFEFPEDWEVPPSAYKMELGWLNQLHTGKGTLTLDTPVALTPRDHIREVTSEEMIFIVTDGGVLARQNSPIVVNGSRYPLKTPAVATLHAFRHRLFYDVLILNNNQ